jgi:hypothetical protein
MSMLWVSHVELMEEMKNYNTVLLYGKSGIKWS